MSWDPILLGNCTLCGWHSLCQGGLCVDCRAIREDSRVARLVCDGLHRGVWPSKGEVEAWEREHGGPVRRVEEE